MFKNITDEELLFLEKIIDNIFDLNNLLQNIDKIPKIKGYSFTANGVLYKNDTDGFTSTLMGTMFEDRKKYKDLMLEEQKNYEKTKDIKHKNLSTIYYNYQLAKKIQLNSFYGSLSNEYFRWFNFENAESITTTGQLVINFLAIKFNSYMNNILNTINVDYIIASDTDSLYINMEPLVNTLNTTNETIKIKAIKEFSDTKLKKCFEKWFNEFQEITNCSKNTLDIKRETIANKAIWKAKKMYILNAWDVEGVTYDTPKLKMQGIEAIRSSTPQACRKAIKESLSIIMNGNQDDLRTYVNKFREEFSKLSFEEVASPRGINGMTKYYDSQTIYKKGTPLQVKGALLFNSLLKKHNIKNIPPIQDGDKVKYAYLKIPNPIHDTVISTSDIVPPEFNLDKYIDRDIQFNKTFLEPLKSITEVIGWNPENVSTLEDFFN